MAEPIVVDFQTIHESGITFNCEDLKRLSQNIFSWIEAFSKTIQKYDECEKSKKYLHFWREAVYAKNYIMRKNFCGDDFRERTFGIVDAGIWYVVYDYNNDAYRGADVPEAIIYLAFMVRDDESYIEQAIEAMDRYALWGRVS